MCINSEKYRGFIIYRNMNPDFGSEYYSIYNPRNQKHVHISKHHGAKQIVDCFYSIHKNKYGRIIRDKSMRLEGYNIIFR